MKRAFIPFAAFIALAVLLGAGLQRDPRAVPSPLVDKPVPQFSAVSLHAPERSLSPADLRGKVWVLNVWASWCVACRQEHGALVRWATEGDVALYGLNYKDARGDALRWLAELGNPYVDSLHDPQGLVGIEFGVYGVPETFVIDRAGTVRMKHVGAVNDALLRDKIGPLLKALNAG